MHISKIIAAFTLAGSAALAADFDISLGTPWDGIDVPDGQQCALFDGNGSTPPMELSNLSDGTVLVHVEFNDLSYQPLSENGGHGTIGFDVSGASAALPSVPGLTNELPAGIQVVRAARSGGQYASDGYLPPCSGGRGNSYSADVIAFDADMNRLGMVTVAIGRY
ncbi:MAG: hypothetical protein JKY31_10435 [Rhodobacteraceae bacterium]|nr:hypothetical protein [Paracoccaceae bacterium]